ncbi:glycosyltransferase [Yersinia kristensenii]|uniref:glycosyltransferase n=1 Tax=Yersinia kristensenii TaxID=28152 RepID=UPI001C60D8D1|nr:glycosyltransferase [Yersinia kristensenii]MBW5826399.1 glycosyltransferase [Yersinia kristensenii]
MNSEKVAVIMSVYDGDDILHIEESINSILSQSYGNLSLFIYIDGVRNEKILSLVKRKTNDNVNVYSFSSDENNGLSYALNFLIDKVKKLDEYKYIARMDADDISEVDRISEQVSFLKSNLEISILGTNCVEINEFGKEIYKKIMPETHDELMSFIFKRSPLIHPTVMFRCDIIDDIRYDATLKNTQDYYLWVDLISKGYKFHNLQKYLLRFRVANNFYTRRGTDKVWNEMNSRLYAINMLKGRKVVNYIYIFLLFFLRVSPECIKKFVYRKMR